METAINLVLVQMQPILNCDQLKRLGVLPCRHDKSPTSIFSDFS